MKQKLIELKSSENSKQDWKIEQKQTNKKQVYLSILYVNCSQPKYKRKYLRQLQKQNTLQTDE